jgi:hypothetical protein
VQTLTTIWRTLAALMILCGLSSIAHAASVEPLLSEISKLPEAARQKRSKKGRGAKARSPIIQFPTPILSAPISKGL